VSNYGTLVAAERDDIDPVTWLVGRCEGYGHDPEGFRTLEGQPDPGLLLAAAEQIRQLQADHGRLLAFVDLVSGALAATMTSDGRVVRAQHDLSLIIAE
jgi:hypothetical protein